MLVIIRNYRAALKTKTKNQNKHTHTKNQNQKQQQNPSKLKVSDIEWYRQTGHIYSDRAVVD